MRGPVQVAWLTGTEEMNCGLAEKLIQHHPQLPLVTVSEFPVAGARWIPFHPLRSFAENRKWIQAALHGEDASVASMILAPRLVPLRQLRTIAILTHGARLSLYDSHLNSGPAIRQVMRYGREILRWHWQPTSPARRWAGRLRRPGAAAVPLYAKLAQLTAHARRRSSHVPVESTVPELLPGVTVIVPSRNGRALLQDCLPRLRAQHPEQIVVVDNGSTDGTAGWLNKVFPEIVVIQNTDPLSFSRAINLGLRTVRYSQVLLLNNDMRIEPGFFAELQDAFEKQPELFCATAQILFPPGQRREETGKSVFREQQEVTEFPVRCEVPLDGEDGTWVLYGSGGCSLFDSKKLLRLGGLKEEFTPAYVEDLDLGFRGWQRGWPTVFCAKALVEHRHRATTARYWTERELDTMVQRNYLLFLTSSVVNPRLFERLWNRAVRRLHLSGSRDALRAAITMPLRVRGPNTSTQPEEAILALTNGSVALFPGLARSAGLVVVIASPYLPFPLSHGGAVRIYHLMREAAREFTLILVSFSDQWQTPPIELRELSAELVLVRRAGTHYRVSTDRPDTVEEFSSPTFAAALHQTVKKWKPALVQLEWTQMAQYAADCAPAKTILVEHDITFDLYSQMVAQNAADQELRAQRDKWRSFEKSSWQQVDRVVTMSERDRAAVDTADAVVIPNGVDTERYQPGQEPEQEKTLLFIGSFAHHPNRSGIAWFLEEVWPLLDDETELNIIAGVNHEQWISTLERPRVKINGFVPDVRPAYRRAAVVIVPLLTSAGTNIKVLEAMAMGKAIVSTGAGVNGLHTDGVAIVEGARAFADATLELLNDPKRRDRAGQDARRQVEQHYTWRSIGLEQTKLYRSLLSEQ